jgi:hypothetical protein
MGGAEMVEPGDELAASEGGASHIIAWQADRNQVLDALKAAFVQGRLTKGEFDQRIGQVLAAYAELDAVTADLPAEPAPARMPEPARESHNRRVIQRGTAAGAGGSMAFAAAMIAVAGGNPAIALIVVPAAGLVVAVVLAGLLTLLSWVLEKGSSRQPSQSPPAGSSAKRPQRLASADSAKPRQQARHDPRHTAEAARSRHTHLRTPGAAVQGV